jgi:hypothetical protein
MTPTWTEKAKGIARKAFAAAWRSGSPALRHRAAVALGRLYLREAERAYGRPAWRGPAGDCTTRPDVAPLPVLVARGGAR